MGRLVRIDAELVRRHLAESRTHARELLAAGVVKLDGQVVTKPARQMDPAQALVISQQAEHYASRGAYKLLSALDYLQGRAPVIAGRRALDAGASTGGFTDVLLRKGAASVVAVDVGYGQLHWSLQQDARVQVLDRTNVRTLQPQQVAPPPQLVVGDLSFISLTLVIPALVRCAAPAADYLLMVKPQFEVGKGRLGKGGVVRDASLHREAIAQVASCAQQAGLTIWDVAPSALPGPAGNIEYFLSMSGAGAAHEREACDVDVAITQAIAARPQGR